MEKYILNETPVRTANNFGINNIELILDVPKIHKEFENFSIETDDIDKIKFEISSDNATQSENRIGLERRINKTVKIIIPENVQVEENIKLEFELDDENELLIENIEIILEKNSSANFQIVYTSSNLEEAFHSGELNINLKENAKAKVVVANLVKNTNNFYEMKNILEKNSILNYIIAEIGGNNKISNYFSQLKGENAENLLNVIYLGKEKETIDINYNIETYGERAKAYINVQGAINDYAKKNFKGTIDFKEGSKKAIGKENENCMILSPYAKSKSLPMLLCHEEEVEGEHGVASGRIDENKLFYIMTKGISYEDARKLIIKANFNDIIRKINDESLEKLIDEEINKI